MRTTIDLPDPLLDSAKDLASARGVTVSVLLADALRGLLAAKPAAVPEPFRLHTVRGRLVQPNLDLDRTSALLTNDDEGEFGARR